MQRTLLLLLPLLIFPKVTWASEPWSDTRLPNAGRDNLILWLDAGKQNAARQAQGLAIVPTQSPVDALFDGSGRKQHFVQPHREAQPTFHVLDSGASIRFDGKTQFLTCTQPHQQFKDMTVFLVTAVNSNTGGFRGFLAMYQLSRNDYQSGLNIDLGGGPGTSLNVLNVEGAGCVGQRNLLNQSLPFAQFTRIAVSMKQGPGGVALFANGQPAARRDRAAGMIHAQQWAIGARLYSNELRPPYVQGFLDGEIAEVLVYDRELSETERQAIDQYLEAKYRQVTPSLSSDLAPGRARLQTVANPPPVQMLMPGFTVHTLPLDLSNINNIRYRPDGKLIALAYDGTIYLLDSTRGDGLENKATVFWDGKGKIRGPIGMALTPKGYPLGQGVFVTSKGKVSLIVDTDGDDKADKEIIIGQGWKELPQGVDTLGVAVDAQGAVYFGFGTADYTNAYLTDAQGKAAYDIKSERGTIVKVSPDFKHREVIATGIRFPVGMMFNKHGDLFATDQEGATWLSNGNPFDELLHIQRGRHYGFPPRHPKHLPHVIDEPSVFDYAPQHQSTCGFCFNGSKPGEPVFGPPSWQGDAFVAGYARGKLYRTQLVKTGVGYVARNHLLACLQMLAVDCCVTPQGHLLVSCHSGPPDWGTGPGGKGKLFQIRYVNKSPQPVYTWSAGPREVRIAFDKPLDVTQLRELSRQVKIEYGSYVYPGDRFETLRPGYAAVQQQLAAPRFALAVYSAGLSPDQRTIVLTTASQPQAGQYVVTLPGVSSVNSSALPQQPGIDLAFNLNGVAVTWKGADSKLWQGVWPHLQPDLAREWVSNSSDHDRLWPLLEQTGDLTLRTQLDLWQMLRPALQPGSTIDYALPAEQVTMTLHSPSPFEVQCPSARIEKLTNTQSHAVKLLLAPAQDRWIPLEVHFKTGKAPIQLEVSYHTNEDPRSRALPIHRLHLPWATPRQAAEEAKSFAQLNPQLAGGNWSRGRSLFLGEATCSKCHMVRGEGSKIGPDLSNLVFRDHDSVLRDIRIPSATINPDYLNYIVVLKDGKTLTGLIQATAEGQFTLTDSQAKTFTFTRNEVDEMTVSKVSHMPEGLDKQLGPDKLTDLMTFLLMQPPSPARLEIDGAPPPRSLSEVQTILKQSTPMTGPKRPLRILLSAGPKDHGPGEHDYPLWQRRWQQLFGLAENVSVDAVQGWPTDAILARTDLLICYSNNPGWSAERMKDLEAYLQRGGGLVLIHYAVDGHRAVPEYARQIGLAWQAGQSKFRHGPLTMTFPDQQHPITRGFSSLVLVDESYWNLAGDEKDIQPLATGIEEGAPRPLLWARQQGKGRVFVSIPGHYTWTFDDPLFRLLILRGMAWSAGEPVERFEGLATLGARMAESIQKRP